MRFFIAAEHAHEFVVHDLDDQLARLDRLDDALAHGLRADIVDELLDDGEGDVGLEQRHADLAQGLVDVLLGQGAATGETVEDLP